ncbi:MAG: hypothetical protein A2508_02985 [Candidatus Lambdaproteobacteria bacterium RIFOXYD12_FULL_49_8]|uniref:Uncharacterized protein n=1 Tax=Candidatus Lambdaproteobacteria bacterium RIFOXYD2_FULL_50_16 TaxID=1817772 RepID=A0A1F6G840_9PROT|nr:MAG: hypothetical protein A2527_14525 [Candidatus Lambdaproteobacteria bacterium RIFOXYD2_FULL_50_16]OGG97549.1 MAG: hypothetical protein A2508_02985 [Candidatus Lambdaproteobacteria bacterium RIFOXYD12_FULL_49_8]
MKRILLGLAATLLPWQAFACSVCFSGREDFLEAFYVTTALLIVLPPTLLGSIIYFIRRRIKQVHAENQLER